MNGKLIYKRKREENKLLSEEFKREKIDHECHVQQMRPLLNSGKQNTPPSSPNSETQFEHGSREDSKNKILLEALQKIMELQKELDDFENDLDYSDEFGLDINEDGDTELRNEAEALGFAICARETLMFLQQEGIPHDSLIYRSLHEKLVGRVANDIPTK